jgi:hypothetical protein
MGLAIKPIETRLEGITPVDCVVPAGADPAQPKLLLRNESNGE